MAANGGRPISQFIPLDTKYYIYQGMKIKFNAAVEYAEKNNINIGKKVLCCFSMIN